MLQLNSHNYFSDAANRDYMSSSQFSAFRRCEAAALAEIQGRWRRPKSTALLVGSFIDSWVEGTLDDFMADNPELFSSRGPTKGQLKAEFRDAEIMIDRIQSDTFFMSYLDGIKQRIVTAQIGGVWFKAKLDIDHPKRIVDFKTMRDFEPIYSAAEGARLTPWEYWGYIRQGAIYREAVRQADGVKKPFFNACVTKQSPPDIAVVSFPDEKLDMELEIVEHYAPHYDEIKKGKVEPTRCERCDFCRASRILTGTVDYLEATNV